MKLESNILVKESKELNVSDDIDKEKEFRLLMKVSDTKLDSQFHVVTKQLLEKFEQRLNNRLPFVAFHDMEKPMGRSVRGFIKQNSLYGEVRVVRGWNYGVDTDQFIKGVLADVMTESSIGARITDGECSVCNKQIFISRKGEKFDDFCWDHRPGRTYKGKLAKWMLKDGELIELSSVTSGANYNTETIDYTRGLISETDVLEKFEFGEDISCILPFLDDAVEVIKSAKDSPPSYFIPPKPGKKPEGDPEMANELEQKLATHLGKASTMIESLPSDQADAVGKIIDEYQSLKKEHETLKQTAGTNKDKADKYDKSVDSIITAALKSGVQAEGDKFNKEQWEAILKGYGDLTLVAAQKKKWDDEADEELGDPNGRQSDENELRRKSQKSDETDEEWQAYLI